VQFGENVRTRVNFICNCCGCCCEALIAARRFGHLHPVHTTGFVPRVDAASCTGCGRCVTACPVEAMSLVSANDPERPKRKVSKLATDICLGCGVCVPACPEGGIRLDRRERREITPLDSVHRTIVMATERGVLQHLLFDNQVLWSHRALAAVFGAVLRLPPVTRSLARRQLRSRFLEKWLERRV
jgi:ferredoxin